MKPKRTSCTLGGDVEGEEGVEGVDDGQDHLQYSHATDGVGQVGVAAAQVEADGDVELACFLVQGQEVGVSGSAAATLAALLEHATRPVLLGKGHLLKGLVHAEERHGSDPAQAPAGLGPLAGHPAVVGLAQGKLDLRASADLGEEEGGVHHLHVDAQFVHVSQAGGDIGEFALGLDSAGAYVVAYASQAQLAVDEPVTVVAPGRATGAAGYVLGYGDGAVLLVGTG